MSYRNTTSATERAEFTAAYAAADAKLHPSPENLHLEALRFVARTVRDLADAGTLFPTESAQFIALYAARTTQLGRRISTADAERLRHASRAFWSACDASRAVSQQFLQQAGMR